MSFYDDASLIVYPSGYKESKIYAQKPVNGTGDLTFTRASSATRVNEQGLIEEASVLGSEEMPSIATIVNLGGGSITQISGNSYSSTSDGTTVSGIRPKLDIAVTAGKKYKLIITPIGSKSGVINFDFYDGASYVFTDYNFVTVKDVTFTANASSVFLAFDGTEIYSISNFTISIKEVITSNVPRIDYTNGCGSLLLEKQSTNLITYSEDFSNAYWDKSQSSVVGGFTSPDGTTSAFKLVDNSVNTTHKVRTPFNLTAGNQYTLSVFAKKGEKNWIYLNDTVTSFVYFDLENGVIGTIQNADNYSITEFGDGWYKCTMTTTASAGARFAVYLADADNGGAYSGNGTDGAYIYGAQLEQSTYPTSYIISNSGTTTTRIADAASKTGISSLINSTEGVLYFEGSALSDDGTSRRISLSDGTISNRVSLEFDEAANTLKLFIDSSTLIVSGINLTNSTKICGKYKANDYALWVNGVEVASATTQSNVPTGLNQLSFDGGNGSNDFYGNCQNLMVFPSALTDDELSDLTGAVHQTFNSLATFYGYTIL